MPAVVLTSKLGPKGLGAHFTCCTLAKVHILTQKALPESTTYALLAGFQNFGGIVSSQLGIFATEFAGIKVMFFFLIFLRGVGALSVVAVGVMLPSEFAGVKVLGYLIHALSALRACGLYVVK